MRPINCGFRSLKGRASIVNPVDKRYFLAYKVQQTFFVTAKKHDLDEQHETRFLLAETVTSGSSIMGRR